MFAIPVVMKCTKLMKMMNHVLLMMVMNLKVEKVVTATAGLHLNV
jgi:hypothetical protein